MAGKKASKTSPRKVLAASRSAEAMKLRMAGHSLAEIAVKLGLKGGAGAVHKAIVRGMELSIVEPAQELRALELARLDALWRNLWARKGNLGTVDRLLKIADQRAKLLGLHAPFALQAPEGASVRFVVEVPAQAPSLAEWKAQAASVIDGGAHGGSH